MPLILIYLAAALAAYLLGSIPAGFLVARAKGIDIRSVGSGNIGATNAMRVLGKPAGIFVLLVDALKGFVACKMIPPLVFNWIAPHFFGFDSDLPKGFSDASFAEQGSEFDLRFSIAAGIAAVLGHNYTCWLRFKGGKGIATTAGVFLALAPWAVLVALIVFILAVLITRYVSVGSMAAALALSATVFAMTPLNTLLCTVTAALSALAIFKHKGNIQRLIAGTESRLGKKSSDKGETK